MAKEAPNQRLSFNLDNLERNVNTCSPLALEHAANVGMDMEKMSAQDSSRFRVLINRYREDCTCVRIPAPTKARAERAISGVKGMIETAKERTAPTVEKIKKGIAPTIEAAKERAAPTIEKIKKGIAPTIEAAKERAAPTIEKIRRGLPSY